MVCPQYASKNSTSENCFLKNNNDKQRHYDFWLGLSNDHKQRLSKAGKPATSCP